ncbi:hypothetical protein NGRA_0712 [Nosema granulosis]|uniref:Uncharacterized protein n=1 Tax=Nosema granulosis TaxID=83296 RepID=A0A9P6KZW6_9MICR|nr:hypothetical protein NGRA_0712 [Nosema granulosis]
MFSTNKHSMKLILKMMLLAFTSSQVPMYLTRDALLNRCKQFAISDDDCMNSTYLPLKEYNAYLNSFNVPVIKDDYCNEGKCIAVIYKDENKCTKCTDKNCMSTCKKVIHTDTTPKQPVQIITQPQHTNTQPQHNIITITKELTRTIDIPKTTTKIDTISIVSSSVNVVTIVSSVPTTSIVTVTKTDISTLKKVSTTTSTSTSSIQVPTVKIVTVTKDIEPVRAKESINLPEKENINLSVPSIKPSVHIPKTTSHPQTNIVTVTREVPTTITVDRPLTLYREVTTTFTSEVPIVNYKVTTFTKKLLSTIERFSTVTTTEKVYLTESIPLTSISTTTLISTITATSTAMSTIIDISKDIPKDIPKDTPKDTPKDIPKEISVTVAPKDTTNLIDQLINKKQEVSISPTVKIKTVFSTISTTVSTTISKTISKTITKEPLTKISTVFSSTVSTSTVSPKIPVDSESKKEDDSVDKLIPLLKELLSKEDKSTKKKKRKNKAINPQTAVELKKPKTVVHTIYSRRKKQKCVKKKTKCIDCDSTCEDSSDLLQGLFEKKK